MALPLPHIFVLPRVDDGNFVVDYFHQQVGVLAQVEPLHRVRIVVPPELRQPLSVFLPCEDQLEEEVEQSSYLVGAASIRECPQLKHLEVEKANFLGVLNQGDLRVVEVEVEDVRRKAVLQVSTFLNGLPPVDCLLDLVNARKRGVAHAPDHPLEVQLLTDQEGDRTIFEVVIATQVGVVRGIATVQVILDLLLLEVKIGRLFREEQLSSP